MSVAECEHARTCSADIFFSGARIAVRSPGRAALKPESRGELRVRPVRPTDRTGARMNQAREGGLDGWMGPSQEASLFFSSPLFAHLQPSHGQGVNTGATVRQCPDGEASSSPASKAAVRSDDTTRKVWLSRSDGRARGKARPSASACGQGQCPGGHGSKVSPVAVRPRRHRRRRRRRSDERAGRRAGRSARARRAPVSALRGTKRRT